MKKDKIKQFAAKGLSYRQIATLTKCSFQYVHQVVKNYISPSNKRKEPIGYPSVVEEMDMEKHFEKKYANK